jgi:hypothetical protein
MESMAAVASAAMIAAGVAFFVMVIAVVVAFYVGVIIQLSCQQGLYGCVGFAGNATVQGDAGFAQRFIDQCDHSPEMIHFFG